MQKKSTQHRGLVTGDMEEDAERERERERDNGERHKIVGETGHIDILSKRN